MGRTKKIGYIVEDNSATLKQMFDFLIGELMLRRKQNTNEILKCIKIMNRELEKQTEKFVL